jgi:hypothetical protein
MSCGSLLIVFGTSVSWLIPVALFGCMFSVTSAYNIVWTTVMIYFPAGFVPFAFGSSNSIGHVIASLSPLVVELKAPVPMIVFVLMNLTTFIAIWFIKNR